MGQVCPKTKKKTAIREGLFAKIKKRKGLPVKNNMEKGKPVCLIPIGWKADLQGLSPTRFKTQLSDCF